MRALCSVTTHPVDERSAAQHDCSSNTVPGRVGCIDGRVMFDDDEIRAAERRLEQALQAADPLAWVLEYTENAVFDGGGDHAVEGREALLEMSAEMAPLSSVSIRPLRTEGRDDLATVWFEASWVSGPTPEAGPTVEVRGMILWRRERDGQWRVAIEHIG
jgi:uncharacterized protein (TIGR02246 family)